MTARRWATASLCAIALLLASCHPSEHVSTTTGPAADETYQRPANASPCEKNQFDKSYALVIGVGDYDYVGKLDAPDSDAHRVYDFLTKDACFDRVVLLTEDNASRDRIAQLMDKDFPDLVKTNDRFFFYFSGHGDTRTLGTGSKRGYLLLKKSHKETWNEMIDMQQVHEWAENFGAARHVLFVLDACFSGLAAFQPKAVSSTLPATLERLSRPSSYLMTAGVEQEESFVFNGSSLFTQAFLAAARGQVDPPENGIVSLDGLIDRINISLDAKRHDIGSSKIKMAPQLYRERFENNEGEFFFMVRPKETLQVRTAALSSSPDRPAFTPRPSHRDCTDCPEIVSIPEGDFMMGSDTDYREESPQHKVHVPAFYIGKYDVTFDEWDTCLAAGGCKKRPRDEGWGRGKRPVIYVSWNDAQEYVRWLSQKTRHTYRLPSEAEWEYAARAGTTTPYYWGKGIGEGNADCVGCGSDWDGKQTAPVGSFAPNPWGLYDIVGNVEQWVQDCWHFNYHFDYEDPRPIDGSAWLTACKGQRVVRGGSWVHDPRRLRSVYRDGDFGVDAFNVVGFRVARTQ